MPPREPMPGRPEGTTELGIDIIKVDRIRDALGRFGARFSRRVLTDAEHALRPRPARDVRRPLGGQGGRLARSSGLGVRGIGWRDIEIVRLPTGQPSVRLHGRAAARAEQLGMGRIAVSISHEARLRGRHRLRHSHGAAARTSSRSTSRRASTTASGRSWPGWSGCASWREEVRAMPDAASGRGSGRGRRRRDARRAARRSTTRGCGAAARADRARPQGHLRQAARDRGSLDYAGAALLVCRAAGRAGAGSSRWRCRNRCSPCSRRGSSRPPRWRCPRTTSRRWSPRGARADPRPFARRPRRRPRASARPRHDRARPDAPGTAGDGEAAPRRSLLDAEALRSLATLEGWWEAVRRPAVLTPHPGEFARLRAEAGTRCRRRRRSRRRRRRPACRGRRGAAAWRQVVVLKGAKTVSRSRTASRLGRTVREPGARDRRNGRRACRDRSGPCSPRA